MAKKRTTHTNERTADHSNVVGLNATILEQNITETLECNYMPYAISVIVSRAIPEIDGFKPSHRKLLYTMYQMKLLGGNRTKSANVVGSTMKLNPHGDAAIYETMVRLSRGYGALLHPFVDSKGNFGKVYSRDMAYAASRYTEVRLDNICQEIFRDIERDSVDFVPNYDGTLQEPTLLPTTFPNILVSANQGIAVGMASSLCGFHLGEVCDTAIARIKDPDAPLMETLLAPDLPTGGEILLDTAEMQKIYDTGRGSFKVRAKWRHFPRENLIEIYEIPYSTTSEAILGKVTDLVKAGKLKEVADMRDETDLSGLKLTIDLKRGVEAEKLMQKLFHMTPLQDSISCNFNVLVDGMPKVMGVGEILERWTLWRMDCIRRQTAYTIAQKEDKLHLLLGLQALLLDIDKAISIIRETELDKEVLPRLMEGFALDEAQADYVADIRLRHINREYILKRTAEIESLETELADLRELLEKPARVRRLIIKQLQEVKKRYASLRKSEIVSLHEVTDSYQPQSDIPDYPVHVFLSREGYLKKITPQSLRMSGEQKYKEGDGAWLSWESKNSEELLLFSDRQQCYKLRLSDLDDSKASLLGDYLPAKLELEAGESLLWADTAQDYQGQILFCFANGKVARVEAKGYQTVTKRKKLTGAYSDKSPLIATWRILDERELVFYSTDGRALLLDTSRLETKSTRNSQGVNVFTLRAKHRVQAVLSLTESDIQNKKRYTPRALPSIGAILKGEDKGEEQLSLLD